MTDDTTGTKRRRVINWGWMWHRFKMVRCRHQWFDGDRHGSKACRKCGVWRWFPFYWSQHQLAPVEKAIRMLIFACLLNSAAITCLGIALVVVGSR